MNQPTRTTTPNCRRKPSNRKIMYDNTARLHDPLLMRFASPDPLYAKFGSLSPWSHCAAYPLNLIDPDGRWNVEVNTSPNRTENPYAIFNVYSDDGDLIFRTVVKVKGQGEKRVTLKDRESILFFVYVLKTIFVNPDDNSDENTTPTN